MSRAGKPEVLSWAVAASLRTTQRYWSAAANGVAQTRERLGSGQALHSPTVQCLLRHLALKLGIQPRTVGGTGDAVDCNRHVAPAGGERHLRHACRGRFKKSRREVVCG